MKKSTKYTIIAGILCGAAVAAASWYAVWYNDARLVAPTELSEFVFTPKDLPMAAALTAVLAYGLFLIIRLLRGILANNRREQAAHTTRRLNPKLGILGFLGLLGVSGFWTYRANGSIFPFCFFIFFGFFAFYFEGKMSDTLIDERFLENRLRAQLTAGRICDNIIFFAVLMVGMGRPMGRAERILIAFLITVTLAVALEMVLSAYLLYRYDHDEQTDGEEA